MLCLLSTFIQMDRYRIREVRFRYLSMHRLTGRNHVNHQQHHETL